MCPNSNELFSVSRVTQSTVHCTDKEPYTEEPSGIWCDLCSCSCSRITTRVSCKPLMLLVGSSRLYSIHHQASCSSPIHLVTEALEQRSSFGPNSDQRGMPSSSVGKVLGHQWLSRWLMVRRSAVRVQVETRISGKFRENT